MKIQIALKRKPIPQTWTLYLDILRAAGTACVYTESWPGCVLTVIRYQKGIKHAIIKRTN